MSALSFSSFFFHGSTKIVLPSSLIFKDACHKNWMFLTISSGGIMVNLTNKTVRDKIKTFI